MKLTRRDLFAAVGGIVLGGAIATTAGLSYRAYRKSLRTQVPKEIKPADEGGWVLSSNDRKEIVAVDQAAESNVLAVRKEVDIPGGDYERFEAGSLQNCVTKCEQDKSCKAFTYAGSRHPVPEKRRVCWLKGSSTDDPVLKAKHYVSGRRGTW